MGEIWSPIDILRDKLPDFDPNTVTACITIVEYHDLEDGGITWTWARNNDVPATRVLGMLRAVQVEIEAGYAAGAFDSDDDE
jgi:hypothetical protein